MLHSAPSGVYPSGYCAISARSLDYCVLHKRPRAFLQFNFPSAPQGVIPS
eukprot:IDg7316t1